MGDAYPELREQSTTIARWAEAEEVGFGRTLEQGERLLSELIERAREAGASEVDAEEAFRLHDTYGFPFEMAKEVLAEAGLDVDEERFAALMEAARERARSAARSGATDVRAERIAAFARGAGFQTRFVGYHTTAADTVVRALERDDGTLLAKLEDSPFYPAGGGQVSDDGVLVTGSGRARVRDVVRLGDDQALALEELEGEIAPGESAHAEVDRARRLATARNHTATHLLHAALRERIGTHVRQAGSYVGPDKLRFDFTHGERLSPDELADVQARVNGWIAAGEPVRAVEMTLDEARALGAMALFGEKYGDWVRMVEVQRDSSPPVSRELCGGTHVASTGEVGLFHITAETSSASNVRRIEAVTGAVATALFEQRTATVRELSGLLEASEAELPRAVARLSERTRERRQSPSASGGDDAEAARLLATAADTSGVPAVVARSDVNDAKALLELSDRVRQKLGDAVVVLGAVSNGRAHLVANVAPAVVERGVRAGEVASAAAAVVGGGGGGRDTMAQAGGREPEKLDDALAAARAAIAQALR
jgi:alanyl-tRNA synthetase